MAPDQEAQAQIARLLGDLNLRTADPAAIRSAIERGIQALADGLLAEAAASDDVFDRETAGEFIADRLRFFGDLIGESQRTRLWQAVQAKIDTW